MVSVSVYFKSSSSLSQKNLNPPSPPLFTHLNAMSTRSPSHEFMQFIGLTKFITGGSRLALRGNLKEFSSVIKVMKSSKSAKLGAWNETENVRLIPGATSPVYSLGYLTRLIVKLSVPGGTNLIRLDSPATFVTLTSIS